MLRFIQSWRETAIQICILLTIAIIPFWLRLPYAVDPFEADYVMGFALTIPLLVTVTLWVTTGLSGLGRILQDPWRWAWLMLLLGFAFWHYASQSWAFIQDEYPGMAVNATLQIVLVVAFIIVVLATPVPRSWLIGVLVISVLFQAVIGGLQVANQSSLGLDMLGELKLDPNQSGVSVIESDGLRWLRPYGFLPHPNIFAGYLVVGIMTILGWGMQQRRLGLVLSVVCYGVVLWALFLTFSRGAWLGFGIGIASIFIHLIRFKLLQWRILIFAGVTILFGLLFLFTYSGLLATRSGGGDALTEYQSVAERALLTEAALEAVKEYPIVGVGAGNFGWYSSYYFFYRTEFDLKGNNVHNIYLMVTAELGYIGLGLFLGIVLIGMQQLLKQLWQTDQWRWERLGFLAGIVALLMIGIIDHYPVTLLPMQVLWLTLLAVEFYTERRTAEDNQGSGE